jgi:O-antigen/teichoic acid export membrane protein
LTIRSEASPRQNGLWAVGQQLASVALSGVFSIVLVRFISVDDFGIYSYATSVAALGAAIMVGGLQGLAIREFRADAESPRIILAALFFVREIMALVVYVLFATYTLVVADGSVVSATVVSGAAPHENTGFDPHINFNHVLHRSNRRPHICPVGFLADRPFRCRAID